jgi:hypothetical protein
MLDKKIINTILLIMKENKVYVIQEIAGTAEGRPKINIMGASKYGEFVFYYRNFHR